MPVNKDALCRYRIINRCLAGGRHATKEQLRTAIMEILDLQSLGTRTIDQDIADMRNNNHLNYNAPIVWDANEKAYAYSDPEYSIDKIPLNADELQALNFAANLLDQYRDVEVFRDSGSAIQKVLNVVKVQFLPEAADGQPVIEFERAVAFKGTEFLQPIHEAITGKRVIQFDYRRFGESETRHHVLHPYVLKEYRNRWYVIGLHNEFNEIRTFGLDRMSELKTISAFRFRSTSFNSGDYFRNTVGVTALRDTPEEIILSFVPAQGEYLLAQPLHSSQQVVQNNEEAIIVKLKIVPTYEFYGMLLGWGSDVTVVSPESVKNHLLEILNETIKKYS